MKIVTEEIEQTTIEKFADKHNLTMEVHERRRPVGDSARYYAHFKGAEVKDGGVLVALYGDGATSEEAIVHYAEKISMVMLVIDARQKTRHEIYVPRLA